MKKKYIIFLIFIGILFAFTLTVGTGYGLWIASKKDTKTSVISSECFKVYYSSSDTIEMNNIEPVVNEEGIESSPYTLTITNICSTEKELQLQLSILDDTTVDTGALTINATGNIEKETTLYKNLDNAKTSDDNITQSKILGSITISPNETVRTNIKMWFDERKAPNIAEDLTFKAKFNLIDKATAQKPTLSETLLNSENNIDSKTTPTFTKISTTSEGLNKIEDEEGTHYYYRGVVTNNYVRFAYQTWRIVGINPDNSVKLILDKSFNLDNYSEKEEYIDYSGLKYIYNDETINNKIEDTLENWYQQIIIDRGFDKYVVSENYCNDTSYTTKNYRTYFSGYNRLISSKKPSLTCPSTNADFGGTYNQKIGLITADEVSLAGGLYNQTNTSYYLYNGEAFWTMTPSQSYNYKTTIITVSNTGAITESSPKSKLGIRPVINLNSSVTVTGSGTESNPYVIDIDE